jgi:hypothetical protein
MLLKLADPVVTERPAAQGGTPFRLVSDYRPAGDQPQAIAELTDGLAGGRGAARSIDRQRAMPCLPASASTASTTASLSPR